MIETSPEINSACYILCINLSVPLEDTRYDVITHYSSLSLFQFLFTCIAYMIYILAADVTLTILSGYQFDKTNSFSSQEQLIQNQNSYDVMLT